MTDEAQMVTSLANFGGKVVDAVAGVGHYAAEVFGTVPHDVVGIAVGDRLRQRRTENAIRYQARTIALLAGVDPARISPPSPSVLIPWMTDAADEERKELCDLWAALLANAALDGGRKVRREFFQTLRQMEPPDAALLEVFPLVPAQPQNETQDGALQRLLSERTGPGGADVHLSLHALEKLGCLRLPSIYWTFTPYGRALRAALTVET